MATSTIPSLPQATTLSGTELLWAVQSGTDVRVSSSQLATLSLAFQGLALNLTQISTAYAIDADDVIVEAIAALGVPTLPTAVGILGQCYIFKNNSGSTITPQTTGGQTIDGSTPPAVANHGVLRVFSDGANWQIW